MIEYLLGEVDSFVVGILRTRIHAGVGVLMLEVRLMLGDPLGRGRLGRLLITVLHASGEIDIARSIGDHRAGSQ